MGCCSLPGGWLVEVTVVLLALSPAPLALLLPG